MVYRIIAIAVIIALLCVYLRSVDSEMFMPALLAGGIVIVFFSLRYFKPIVDFITLLTENSGINSELIVLCFKTVSVAYLVEFACGTIEDCGLKGLSDKLAFAGRLIIFCMALPVFSALLNLISSFLESL